MKKIILVVIGVCFYWMSSAQSGREVVDQLEELINQKDYKSLQKIAHQRITHFDRIGKIDSVCNYIHYEGIAILTLNGINAAKERMNEILLHYILKKNADGKQITHAYSAAANVFAAQGYMKDGYQLVQQLIKNPELRNKTENLRYRIENTLAYYAMRLGHYALTSSHYRNSITSMPGDVKKTVEYFTALNGMAIAMYYESKFDSAIFYSVKAKNFLISLDNTPVNRYYRLGMLEANMGNIYGDMGETKKSLELYESAIENYRTFLAQDSNYPQKPSTQKNLFYCIDNMAGNLLETGDFTKAKSLYSYGLKEKQRVLGNDDPEVYDSYLNLSGLSLAREDANNAINYAQKALVIIKKVGDTITAYDAEAYSKLAQAYFKLGQYEKSASYFEMANHILNELNAGAYSSQQIGLIQNYARLLAKMQQKDAAVQLADISLQYLLKSNDHFSYPVGVEYMSQVEVYKQLHNYNTVKDFSNKAIVVFDKLISNAPTILDSMRFENFKAGAILGKSVADYHLLKTKDKSSLQKILNDLKATTALFERRKLYFTNYENINYTIEYYKEINDFINQLQLDLYNLTGNTSYLDSIVSRNESLVYTRLKKAMYNRQVTYHFKDVPASVLEKEASILKLMEEAIATGKPDKKAVNAYFKQSLIWDDFLSMLKNNYPKYYHAKYGSAAGKTLNEIQKEIPEKSQLIRFYTVNDIVYALVLSSSEKHWVQLPAKDLKRIIDYLQNSISIGETGKYTYELYKQLWQPIEKYIHSRQITIIPDGVIYNISFEMLTSKPVANASDFLHFSLLKKHAFSYQYSLDVISQKEPVQKNFSGIAVFAPGFSEEIKEEYKKSLSDSLKVDYNYMTLLPLPFSSDFASRIRDNFKSTVYIGKNSTLTNFKSQAGKHSIIYIGTHAEANNQFPEYSRIMFAKNLSKPLEDHSLYLHDIYNQELSADLAILTACETGQSSAFMGEGMISMAHAFNYAGSKSILTGLWKIDEYASVKILESFYDNLEKGMTKDIALQQAKIAYLESAQGRMMSPQYWAGLVIMGDISPISIKKNGLPKFLWIGGSLLILTAGYFGVRKMIQKKAA